MLTKGIVEKLVDSYKIKVRIPIYNKPNYINGATSTDNLYEACICTLPNCCMNVQVGDIVILGFEDGDTAQPIILGCLYAKDITDSKVDLISNSLQALNSAILPQNTSIGKVTARDLGYLTGLKSNVQGQIDTLVGTKAGGWVTIVNHSVESDLDSSLHLDIPEVYQKPMTELRLRYYACFASDFIGSTEPLSIFFGDIADMAWGLAATGFYPTRPISLLDTTVSLNRIESSYVENLKASVPDYNGNTQEITVTGILKSDTVLRLPIPVSSVKDNTVIATPVAAGSQFVPASVASISKVIENWEVKLSNTTTGANVAILKANVYQTNPQDANWDEGNYNIYQITENDSNFANIPVGTILSIGKQDIGTWVEEVNCKWYISEFSWAMCEANYSIIGKNLIQTSLVKTPLNGAFTKEANYTLMRSQTDDLAYLVLDDGYLKQIVVSKPTGGKIYKGSQLIIQCKFV